jgi:hypothetical protein
MASKRWGSELAKMWSEDVAFDAILESERADKEAESNQKVSPRTKVRRAEEKVKDEAPKVKRKEGDRKQVGKPLLLHERMALEFQKRKEKIEKKSSKRREAEAVTAAKDCEDQSLTSKSECRDLEEHAEVRRKGWTSSTQRRKEPISETHYMRQLRTVSNKVDEKRTNEVTEPPPDSQTVMRAAVRKSVEVAAGSAKSVPQGHGAVTLVGSSKDDYLDTPSYLRTSFHKFKREETEVVMSTKKLAKERGQGGSYFGGARRGTAGAQYMGGEARAPDDHDDLVTTDCVEPMDYLQVQFAERGKNVSGRQDKRKGGRDERGDKGRDKDQHATDARGRNLDDCDDKDGRRDGKPDRLHPKVIPKVFMDGRGGYTQNCMTPGDEDGRDLPYGSGPKGSRSSFAGR